ncbi:MAG: hypothetical protein ACR2GA_05255 [Chloroflexota bacterium]
MVRVPSPPVVTAATAGFVAGVLVALVATGVVTRSSHSSAAPLPTPPPVRSSVLTDRVRHIVTRELGPLTNQRLPRLVSLQLTPALIQHSRLPAVVSDRYQSVRVIFRLNNHPLGPSWRLKAAKADVFGVMDALYSSNLPIYNIELIGRFAVPKGKQTYETRVMVAIMSYRNSTRLPWKHWGRENEALLWKDLSYHWLDPRFA